jgi:predicted ribosome quality control (RQC) complex YloA/Tae2 family protein
MKKKKIEQGISLQIDADELKGRQSVRTTFKLPEKTINLLKISAKHLGIQQKTLLDQLIEDETILNVLAKEAQTYCRNDHDCRPKTFVLSRKALDLIDVMLDRYDIARDILVDLSIARLTSYIESLSEKHDQKRSLLKEIDKYQQLLEELSSKAKTTFKQEDPFRMKLEILAQTTQKCAGEMKKMVKDKHDFIY